MNYELKIIPDTRIAFFCWHGPISLDQRLKNRNRVVDFCKRNNLRRLLVDVRQHDNITSFMELFEFGESFPRAAGGLKTAVVRDPSDADIEFVENVASNRGAFSRCFENIEEAQSWL